MLRVRKDRQGTDTVELESQAYAVAVGGPSGKHLVICASATHDPAEIAAARSAQLLQVVLD